MDIYGGQWANLIAIWCNIIRYWFNSRLISPRPSWSNIFVNASGTSYSIFVKYSLIKNVKSVPDWYNTYYVGDVYFALKIAFYTKHVLEFICLKTWNLLSLNNGVQNGSKHTSVLYEHMFMITLISLKIVTCSSVFERQSFSYACDE